jgi:hypothetical protein
VAQEMSTEIRRYGAHSCLTTDKNPAQDQGFLNHLFHRTNRLQPVQGYTRLVAAGVGPLVHMSVFASWRFTPPGASSIPPPGCAVLQDSNGMMVAYNAPHRPVAVVHQFDRVGFVSHFIDSWTSQLKASLNACPPEAEHGTHDTVHAAATVNISQDSPTKNTAAQRISPPKDTVVVGDCIGNSLIHELFPDIRGFSIKLARAAFPERSIVVNALGDGCTPSSQTLYDRTDILIVVGGRFDDKIKRMVDSAPHADRIRWDWTPTDTPDHVSGVDGILIYQHANIVRHTHGRPFIIGMVGEASHGRGSSTDMIIDCKLDRSAAYVHTQTTTMWWPLASRYLYLGIYAIETPEDLIVQPDFDVATALAPKTEFCAFRHHKCDKKFYQFHGAPLRVALFDTFKQQGKPCTSLGSCRLDNAARDKWEVPSSNEWPRTKGGVRAPPGGLKFGTSSVMSFQPFRFVVAIENSFANG